MLVVFHFFHGLSQNELFALSLSSFGPGCAEDGQHLKGEGGRERGKGKGEFGRAREKGKERLFSPFSTLSF